MDDQDRQNDDFGGVSDDAPGPSDVQDDQAQEDALDAAEGQDAQAAAADSGVSEEDAQRAESGIATEAQNAALEHSEGGTTTRDTLDGGVPMQQGDASEPVGPEDALGKGEKRGDYEKRVGGSHAESVPVEGGGEPIRDEEGNIVDYKPASTLVDQTARVADQGDVPGEKGGVTT